MERERGNAQMCRKKAHKQPKCKRPRADNFPVVLLLAISAFREEKDGFSTPPRQNKRRILQINGIKKCDRNIKCICGELAFQILKIAWFVAALPWQLKLHLYGAHIENFEFSLFLR